MKVNDCENVIKIITSGEGLYTSKKGNQKKVLYLVTELVTGGEFFDFIAETGQMKEDEARFYYRQLLGGMAYLHRNFVFHRDLKLENLMLDENFNLKIIDFGLAHVQEDKTSKEPLYDKVGTTGYQPPNMVYKSGYKPQEPDLFASAVILFIIVAGSPPFGDTRYGNTRNSDAWYNLIANQNFDKFWRAQTSDGTSISNNLR